MSAASFVNFFLLNCCLLLIGLFQFYFQSEYTFFTFLARNYVLLQFIEYGTRNKTAINTSLSKIPLPTEAYKYEFHVNVITTTAVETLTHLFIIDTEFSQTVSADIIYFIPVSFVFELLFDFFHYFAHRLLHSKHLYKFIHKKHHKFPHPIAITAFYQEPLDLVITNSVPTALTLFLFPYVSSNQFVFLTVYKKFVEISGHTGKISKPSCSFPQFIWLPKMLHIELYTEDHDLHHSLNNCNYAKRFSMWDKLFNTYKQPKITYV